MTFTTRRVSKGCRRQTGATRFSAVLFLPRSAVPRLRCGLGLGQGPGEIHAEIISVEKEPKGFLIRFSTEVLHIETATSSQPEASARDADRG
jgi:hypothetical protein